MEVRCQDVEEQMHKEDDVCLQGCVCVGRS